MARTKKIKERRTPAHFLRAWRKERKLSQQVLAERAATSHGTISRLENGEIELVESRLLGLAAVLRISPGDIYRDPADPGHIWEIASKISDLPTDKRATVLTQINALAEEAREKGQG